MKYFVVSDIHSFAKELKSALRLAGFDKKDKDHTLIVCGDIFDRGPDTVEVYKFLTSIPKKRRVLVKGNHEELYFELLKKKFPDNYDFSNHTVDTFCHIAGYSPDIMGYDYWFDLDEEHPYERIQQAWQEIRKLVEESEITKWLMSDEWVDYFELDNFIFVHSFIPLRNIDGLPGYYTRNRHFEYFPDWRTNATALEWSDSRWGAPHHNFGQGYFKEEAAKGKTLVVGHWVVTDFRDYFNHEFRSENTNIFYIPNFIGLDCGVWHYRFTSDFYHPQNVLVIDGGKCYDKYGKELEDESIPIIETVPASKVEEPKDAEINI